MFDETKYDSTVSSVETQILMHVKDILIKKYESIKDRLLSTLADRETSRI